MSGAIVYLEPAYILQHRPYRETSLILDVFTRQYGVISILAKGVRKEKSKTAGLLLPFTHLKLSYQDRHELKLLIDIDFVEHYNLQKLSLYCGFYVNELIQRFMHKQDANPGLFSVYANCVRQLAICSADEVEQILRYFEIDMLDEVGYGVDFEEVRIYNKADDRYSYIAYSGFFPDVAGVIRAGTLQKMAEREHLNPEQLQEAKQLMRSILHPHLQGKPLKSRQVLATLMNYI